MTESSEHWRIWDTLSPIKPWAMSFVVTASPPRQNAARARRGSSSLRRIWQFSLGSISLRWSADLARFGHLLCAVLPSSGDQAGELGRDHAPSHRDVDGAG